MFARVSTYRAPDAQQLAKGFEGVTDPLERMEGFSHSYFLVDRDGEHAMSITVWHTEEAMTASDPKADELRRTGADAGGGSIESVRHYEIALAVGDVVPGLRR